MVKSYGRYNNSHGNKRHGLFLTNENTPCKILREPPSPKKKASLLPITFHFT